MALQGDTVLVCVEFRAFKTDELYDPDDVKLLVLRPGTREVLANVEVTEKHHVGEGQYEVPYTLPMGLDSVNFVFEAVDGNGYPVVARQTVRTEFSR